MADVSGTRSQPINLERLVLTIKVGKHRIEGYRITKCLNPSLRDDQIFIPAGTSDISENALILLKEEISVMKTKILREIGPLPPELIMLIHNYNKTQRK